MKNTAEKVYANNGNPEALALVSPGAIRILDLGCGAGSNAKLLQSSGRKIDGVTLSESEAKIAKAYCENVWVHNLENGLPEDLEAEYDCCLCSHVIEHLATPTNLLFAARRILIKKGGSLVVALPNFLFWKSRIKFALGRFEYHESGPWDHTHLRWYTFQTGRKLLEDHGFKIQKAFAEGFMPQPLIRSLSPVLGRTLDKIVVDKYPGLFGWQLLYTATPI